MDYKQPDFYHFNQDSISLVKYIQAKHAPGEIKSIYEAFSGCGVIGIELSLIYNLNYISFNEYQKDFKYYIQENINLFNPHLNYDLELKPFGQTFIDQKYDLFVANPPYFTSLHHRKSPDERRQICRGFEIESFEEMLIHLRRFKDNFKWIYFLQRGELRYPDCKRIVEISPHTFIYQLT